MTPPSRFPGITADLTLTHPLATPWAELAAAVEAHRPPELTSFGLKVRYQGEGVPAGAVNTTLFFLYNSPERSLTQEEVNLRQAALAAELGAPLRPSCWGRQERGAMSDDTGWLEALEERVHQAAERLGALGEENAGLRARIAELEGELATASAAADGAAPAGAATAPPDPEAERWRRERAEVRRRVEKLAERLGELLASAGG